MKNRAIFISSISRIAEIKKEYRCEIPKYLLNSYLFELSDLSPLQKHLLDSSNIFAVYETKKSAAKLVSIKDYSNLKKHFNNDPEFSTFCDSLKKFYSSSVKPIWRFPNQIIDFNNGPMVMGILNVTPDSFYDGARYNHIDKALEQAFSMSDAGAKIIDIGGESTRPGASKVSHEEEIARVIPVIKELSRQSKILVSIDTYKSEVAREALDAGADIVNDISGAGFDTKMIPLIKQKQCPYIVMHIKGTPVNMQQNPYYGDTMHEIYRHFEDKINYLQKENILNIAIDPGIGFGKRLEDNLRLIRDLRDFTYFNLPILVGASRKSMIGDVLNVNKDERLSGSLSVHLRSVLNGADIIRTHDVRETVELLKISKAIDNP
jgi:dihydropteroate synthase